jgi:glycosyltransferase involved in cell wall biosynthesis
MADELGIPVVVSKIEPLKTPAAPIKLLAGVNDLLRIIKKENIDIIHSNTSARGALYAGIASLRARIPAVWHVRILDPDPILDRLLFQIFKKVITNSDSVGSKFRGFPRASEKLITIHNPVDLDVFRPAPPDHEIRSSLGAGHDDVLVVTVGRLVEFKGHKYFIEAAARIAGTNHPMAERIKFAVVGGGPLSDELKKQAAASKATGKIVFTGHRDDIPAIMNAMDIFALPSIAEHFGRVVIEAMACRKPVIGTCAGGVPEIIEDGVSGILVPPRDPAALADAIMSLATDREKAKRVASAGEERAQKLFSIKKHADAVMAVYDEISNL